MLQFVKKTWLYTALAIATLGGLVAGPAHAVDVDKLIPADAESVVGIQFKQILEAPILKKFGIDGLACGLPCLSSNQLLVANLGE